MNTNDLRRIAQARRGAADKVRTSLQPLERAGQDLAVQASAFATLLLETHAEIGLPLHAGADLIELAQESARLSAQSRAKTGELHRALVGFWREFMPESGPECPEDAAKPHLQIVA